MNALPVPNRVATDRIIIRPQTWVVAVTAVSLGIGSLIPGAAGVLLIIKGQPAGLIFLALGAFSWGAIYLTVGGYLWADAERVGSTRLVERGSYPRAELAYMKIGVPIGRSGAPCLFVRKDGSVAFRTSVAVWGKEQLLSLAAYLQLPMLDATHPIRHICPVCGYTGLEEPASSNGTQAGRPAPADWDPAAQLKALSA